MFKTTKHTVNRAKIIRKNEFHTLSLTIYVATSAKSLSHRLLDWQRAVKCVSHFQCRRLGWPSHHTTISMESLCRYVGQHNSGVGTMQSLPLEIRSFAAGCYSLVSVVIGVALAVAILSIAFGQIAEIFAFSILNGLSFDQKPNAILTLIAARPQRLNIVYMNCVYCGELLKIVWLVFE